MVLEQRPSKKLQTEGRNELNEGKLSDRERIDLAQVQLCNTCQLMAGIWQGLQALISDEGYRHLDCEPLLVSARKGLPVCTHLANISADPASSHHVFLDLEADNCDILEEMIRTIEHPCKGKRITTLAVDRDGECIHEADLCVNTIARQ